MPGDFDIPARRKKRIHEIYAEIVPVIILIEEDMLSGTVRANSGGFDPNRSDAERREKGLGRSDGLSVTSGVAGER